ncbi:hypothetical protein [Nitrospina gracilis]|uniref:hypothetical protein n=1 Tax=Nitrospina gracilis TaxID=35801 RepID=UPI001F2121D4|nr:hypothetical protein [Nitrospina gracilis]MCF8721234.1 hypothetical protein [Nitrospina gracilis Nb-211]
MGKKIIFLFGIVIFLTMTSNASGESIRKKCKDEWGTDYRMVEYCIKKQSAAKGAVDRNRNNVPKEIMNFCEGEWKDDHRMLKYCIEKEVDALVFLNKNKSNFDREIFSTCLNEWHPDYKMVKYCAEKQQAAKDRLSR